MVVPSFTFSASAHAAAWAGATPVFCECDPTTFQADAADVARRDGDVVLITHVFGAPAPVDALTGQGRPLVFDAAHALGAIRAGTPVGGFGDAEVFSLTPTKPLVAGEGGLVATRRDDIARFVRIGREYGNPGSYDTEFPGLNARLSELHAALALEGLETLDEHLALRTALAARYAAGLADVPGVRFQAVDPADVSTHKDLTIAIDPDQFGLDRDALVLALRADGIDTRNYFHPPIHRQQAYRDVAATLPVTDDVASRVVSLPMFGRLALTDVDLVCEVIAAAQARADEIRARAA